MKKDQEKYLISDLKLAIIYGKNEVDGENKDGEIEKIYKQEDDTAHIFYMKNYLKTHLKGIKEIKQALEDLDINSVAYEIQKLGHIVMAENTSTEKNKRVIMYLPENLSTNQTKALEELIEKFKKENYTIIALLDLKTTEDGILDGKQRIGTPEILSEYIEYISDKQQKSKGQER